MCCILSIAALTLSVRGRVGQIVPGAMHCDQYVLHLSIAALEGKMQGEKLGRWGLGVGLGLGLGLGGGVGQQIVGWGKVGAGGFVGRVGVGLEAGLRVGGRDCGAGAGEAGLGLGPGIY